MQSDFPEVMCFEVENSPNISIILTYEGKRKNLIVSKSIEALVTSRETLRGLAKVIADFGGESIDGVGKISDAILKRELKTFVQICKDLHECVFKNYPDVYADLERLSNKGHRIEYCAQNFIVPFEFIIPNVKSDYDLFPHFIFQSGFLFRKQLYDSNGKGFDYCNNVKDLSIFTVYNKELLSATYDEIPHIKSLAVKHSNDGLDGTYENTSQITNYINTGEFNLLHIASHFHVTDYPKISYFDFSNGVQLSLSTIDEDIDADNGLKGKIVFLNACNTSNKKFHHEDNCTSIFDEKGAAGIISVDLVVRSDFAAEFSKKFYNHLIVEEPITVEKAVYETKIDLLSKHKILALFYSYFGKEIKFNQ